MSPGSADAITNVITEIASKTAMSEKIWRQEAHLEMSGRRRGSLPRRPVRFNWTFGDPHAARRSTPPRSAGLRTASDSTPWRFCGATFWFDAIIVWKTAA